RCKRGDHRCVAPDQIGSHGRKPVELPLRPTIFDGGVAAVLITLFAQSPPKGCDHRHECIACSTIEKTDHRHCWLLRARRKGPRRRAAEQREELASLIKKLRRHDAVAIDFNSTEKPSSARRLMRRRACVSGRRRSKWVGPRSL